MFGVLANVACAKFVITAVVAIVFLTELCVIGKDAHSPIIFLHLQSCQVRIAFLAIAFPT